MVNVQDIWSWFDEIREDYSIIEITDFNPGYVISYKIVETEKADIIQAVGEINP